jgi:hypothetical protein
MNCPNCLKELPVNYDGAYCPVCGKNLPAPPNLPKPLDPSQKINWLIFFSFLLGPVVLTIATVLLISNQGNPAADVAAFGGAVSGIICGGMLGRRVGTSRETKIVLGIVFAVAMTVVCIGMNCFGCLASGYGMGSH